MPQAVIAIPRRGIIGPNPERAIDHGQRKWDILSLGTLLITLTTAVITIRPCSSYNRHI